MNQEVLQMKMRILLPTAKVGCTGIEFFLELPFLS
jgi:hypothetical protein